MRAYGIPRYEELDFPDVGTIQEFGLKQAVGGKNYCKNSKTKRATRRIYKKRERTRIRQSLRT